MSVLSVLLFAVSIAGWMIVTDAPPSARAYLRFACILCAALAVAEFAGARLADAVTLLVAAIVPALLAIATYSVFRTRVPSPLAGLVLALCSIAGMAAAGTGLALFAFAPLLAAVLAMMVTALRGFNDMRLRSMQAMASAIALLAGASVYAGGGANAPAALVLFFAAGLLGCALVLTPRSETVVDQEAAPDLRTTSIRHIR
jgi:hypothetical protein